MSAHLSPEPAAIDYSLEAEIDNARLHSILSPTHNERSMYHSIWLRLVNQRTDQPRFDHTPALSESESGDAAHDGVQPERAFSTEAA